MPRRRVTLPVPGALPFFLGALCGFLFFNRKRRIVALVRDGGWTKASTRHPSRGFARRAFRWA